ncbi:hypothetical protein I6N90_16420 [Paenibacillus sp. GSMTC-2017]|uniref:hypothetical protein n=1 Tax=Paenibacillus sp. GSMTC-2017 TaxID=2794350 RepID=UPI001A323780|nr:hypothetical protein [Paenibacillus sp. GSMTC-2017]MBH5319384.1 hypothetical protein [Paenibacillus sp. GSMTC-2017]
MNSRKANSKAILTTPSPNQFKWRMEEWLITRPPKPEPSANPNWMKEVFTLKAISGEWGTNGHGNQNRCTYSC